MRIKSARKRRIISRAKMLLKIFFPYPGVPGRLMIKVPPIIAITMSTLKKISIPSAVKCIYSFLVENILPLRGQVQDLPLPRLSSWPRAGAAG